MADNKYDFLVLGGGMGGLVCASYLARAGNKVAIIDKNKSLGGCCTTFMVDGFEFDPCVHSIGSCRDGGFVFNILNELNLSNKISFKSYDPSDIVIHNGCEFYFGRNVRLVREMLLAHYPQEISGVDRFLKLLHEGSNVLFYNRYLSTSFAQLLDDFFYDSSLKAVLGILLFGNTGLPPSKLSAFTGLIVFKEFILDGGYVPVGGIHSLPMNMADAFIAKGGEVFLESEVVEINYDVDCVSVILKSGNDLRSEKVIVNYSPHEFLDQAKLNVDKGHFLMGWQQSLSAFSVFLGVKEDFCVDSKYNANIWDLPSSDLNQMYEKICRGLICDKDVYLLTYTTGLFKANKRKTVSLFVNAPYMTSEYWHENNNKFVAALIDKVEARFPSLLKNIEICKTSSPHTIYKYTKNYLGATYGINSYVDYVFNKRWAGFLNSIERTSFVGHWTARGSGVPAVMDNGRKVAFSLLRASKTDE